MKFFRNFCVGLLLLFFISGTAFCRVPIRASSENGQTSKENKWKLMGRSVPIVLSSNGKSVTMTREVLCQAQDVYAGKCNTNGPILFVFQLQSISTGVTVSVGKVPGVIDAGILACDDVGNKKELCTEDTTPPSLTAVADAMTATIAKTSVTFTNITFQPFPAGINVEEGQGLTLYVTVQQSTNLPVTYPNIGIF
jgi:hypothetical protein